MEMIFAFYDVNKESPVPIKRQFVIKAIEFNADKSLCRGEVIEKNEWAVPEIGTIDIFITKQFEKLKTNPELRHDRSQKD